MTPQDEALVFKCIDSLRTLEHAKKFLCALGMHQRQAATLIDRIVKSEWPVDNEFELFEALRRRGNALLLPL